MSERPLSFPWDDETGKVVKPFSLRVPDAMMTKLQFLKEHEPNISVHKLILSGIQRELDARLPTYGYTGSNKHG